MDLKRLRAMDLRRSPWLLLTSVFILACVDGGRSNSRELRGFGGDNPHHGGHRPPLGGAEGFRLVRSRERSESSEESGVNSEGQCNYGITRTSYTECVQCEMSHTGMCPTGSKATTSGQGLRDCSYSLRVPGHYIDVDLSGCRHECEHSITVRQCCDGYWGPQCQECPGGASNPCHGHGQCSGGIIGDGSCNCFENFGGDLCDQCVKDNYYGPDCASKCTCVHGICDDGIRGQGHCLCLAGYFGSNCTEMREECKRSNCTDHSHCHELKEDRQSYTCRCDQGYKANEESGTCMEIDPCTLNSTLCHQEATCMHTGPNQHSCDCNEGFEGDGQLTCRPINPCNTDYGGCPTNTTLCVFDGPGQSHCQCKWGYESYREGIGCSLLDICPRRTDCHINADCRTVRPYEIRCICKPGYMGDGYICYGNIIQQLLALNADVNGPLYGDLSSAISSIQQIHGSVLTNAGPFTVFIPNENAFNRIDADIMERARDDTEFARYLYGLHIVPALLDTNALNQTDLIYTLTGMPAVVTYSDRDPNLLRYRVKGASNKAKMVEQNHLALNGIIHVIDRIMYTEPRVASDREQSIFELIAHEGLFNRLQGMIQEAQLASLIHDREGPFTVLAPNNAAFDKLLQGTLDFLTTTEGKVKLVQLLKNHIISGSMLTAADLLIQKRIPSMQRITMAISTNDVGTIQIEDPADSIRRINVTQSNILASNGYIHYIDGLLIPPTILPLVKHRCDITQTQIINGSCTMCGLVTIYNGCPVGTQPLQNTYESGCTYTNFDWNTPTVSSGCYPLCNKTETIQECCSGFYGESCLPCPGGFVTPCNNNGQCLDGFTNNGTCLCKSGFIGTACELCRDNYFGRNCSQACTCVHGVCNNGPNGNGRCNPGSCSIGYTGDNCEEFVHPCGPELDQCHTHAHCEITDTIQCVCNAGYAGDGFNCLAVDPCTKPTRGGCHAEAQCIYTGPGVSKCECNEGWFGDGHACVAIDNCQLPSYGGCDLNADCTFTGPGENDCNCHEGYMGNGIQCTPINSCLSNYGGCHNHAVCSSTGAGTNMCTCNQGFVGNGLTCFSNIAVEIAGNPDLTQLMDMCEVAGMDRQLADPSYNITLFAPINQAFDAMSMQDRNTWLSKNNAATCIKYHILNGAWSYQDLMNHGEGLMHTLLTDADIIITMINGELFVDGSRIVAANLPASNGIIHMIDEVLVPPTTKLWSAPPTIQEFFEENLSFSKFKESLVEFDLVSTLSKLQQYTIFVPNNDAFIDLDDEERNHLVKTVMEYHIIPEEKFYSHDLQDGFHHQTLLGHNYQLTFSIHGNGVMINNQAYIIEPDLTVDKGVIHGISKVLDVIANRCDLNHTSTVPSACVTCTSPPACPNGYSPIIPPEGIHENCRYIRQVRGRTYTVSGCQVTCIKTQYTPLCCPGFHGISCRACPGGAANPCNGNGVCNDGINANGSCTCKSNFAGTACELCAPGFLGDDCSRECPCVNGSCVTSSSSNVICVCNDGWIGPRCDIQVTDSVVDCPQPCDVNAFCVAVGTEPECMCKNGFRGDGQTCIEEDLCADNNGGCSEFASCMNIAGRPVCRCDDGYTGDGVYCGAIDPCDDNNGGCHEHAECVQTGVNMRVCNCLDGYQGDGIVLCQEQNPCENDNGGCSIFAKCTQSGPNMRQCTCLDGYIGDGITCVGSILDEIGRHPAYTSFNSLVRSVLTDALLYRNSLSYTVFVPNNDAFRRLEETQPGQLNAWRQNEQMRPILAYHIVGCVTSTVSDMQMLSSLTSMSGQSININTRQDSLILNGQVRVLNELLTSNGVIHEIDQILVPEVLPPPKQHTNQPPGRDDHRAPPGPGGHGAHSPQAGSGGFSPPLHRDSSMAPTLQDVAQVHGYNIFNRVLLAAGLVQLVSDPIHTPFTIFMPTDEAFSYLPDGKLAELQSRDNIGILQEYLKYHMIRDRKISPQDLMLQSDLTTLQGSDISVGCWGNQGDIYVNGGDSRIVQRSLFYNGGVLYGIDRVLEPPSIGGRCDIVSNRTEWTTCRSCSFPPICPPGGRATGPLLNDCNYVVGWYNPKNGCRQKCTMHQIEPRCCDNHYGGDCRECPGGARNPCSGHGTCLDGHTNNGTCVCSSGFIGSACEMCQPGYYGRQCTACQCTEHGICVDGMTGDGSCFCQNGWVGTYCEIKLHDPLPTCDPGCSESAVCRLGNICECKPHYYGDGRTCTVVERCKYDNGGCSMHADCQQINTTVICSCHDNYEGDGVVCRGIDLCDTNNGGCHKNATCRYSGPNTRTCTCNSPFEGDGLDCKLETNRSPCSRLPSDCSENAYCIDIPPSDSLPYGDVRCVCKSGYIGNGTMCNGDMYETLASISLFSEFFKSIMQMESKAGSEMIQIFQDVTSKLTVFVPLDGSIPPNMTLSSKGVKSHILYGNRPLKKADMYDGAKYTTMSGSSVYLTHKKDAWYINDIFIIEFDLPTMNGFVHVIKMPLVKPVPESEFSKYEEEKHYMKSRIVAIIVVSLALVALIVFLTIIWYRRRSRSLDLGNGPIVCSRYSSGGSDGGSVSFGTKTNSDEKSVFDNPVYGEATISIGDNTS
ncbi:stabilin-2-like isoform X3 [Ptychodera flava]|uniref:stabilin-2-like isoform X3 n=1 Tax=Ptychodera flava TaxID=63121 RepID=UPI00396A423B